MQVMAVSFYSTNTLYSAILSTRHQHFGILNFKFKIKHWKEKEVNCTLISQQNKTLQNNMNLGKVQQEVWTLPCI